MTKDIPTEARESARTITVDYEKYAHHLAESELSDDDKREVLRIIWQVCCEFVALGFEVQPVSKANKDSEAKDSVLKFNSVKSKLNLKPGSGLDCNE